jgi:hypothetical protein
MLFVLAHLCILHPTITTHPTCVFPSLANDTHIASPASDVLLTFLHLYEELLALGLSVYSSKCATWSSKRLNHFISLPLGFFIPDLGFYILGTLMGFIICD